MARELRRGWPLCLMLFGWLPIASPELSAQEIVAPSARTLFNRSALLRTFVEVKRLSLRADGKSTDVTQYVPVVAVVYGFYPKWTAIVAQPFVIAEVSNRGERETRSETFSGLADTQLFVQYDGLYSRNSPGGLTRLSGIFGLQLPTGATRFSTGAVEYTGGLIFEKAVGLRYVFTSDFQYTIASENSMGVSMGDRARFDAVPAYFLISRDTASPDSTWLRKLYDRMFRSGAYLILEFNGTWRGHARNRGTRILNTGGTTLSISPGIQYFLSDRFLVEFASPIPVVRAVNGKQAEPRSSLVFGFRYLF